MSLSIALTKGRLEKQTVAMLEKMVKAMQTEIDNIKKNL